MAILRVSKAGLYPKLIWRWKSVENAMEVSMGRAIGIVTAECELTSYDAGKAGGSTEKYTSPRHVRLPLINRVFEPVGGILSARVIFTCAEG